YYHYKLTANTIAGETSDTTLGGDGTYHTTRTYAPAPPTLSATSNEAQQVTLTWSGVAGADNYTVYWDNVSFSDNNSRNRIENVLGSSTNNVCTSGNCTYIHGGRDSGTTYYYRVAAVSPSSVVGTRSNVASGTPSGFDCSGFPNLTAQPQADNDPDLLVYYDFNADLADKKRKYNDNRYDLIGAEGFELVTAGSCYSGNRAAYFSGQGYAHNDNFTDDNETALQDNFTVSVWFNAAADMIDTSALMSSRFVTNLAGDNNVIRSFQLDSEEQSNGSKKLRYRSAIGGNDSKKTLSTSGTYGLNQWHHLVFVKYDKTVELYLDNVSSTNTHNRNDNLTWSTLKVGINRMTKVNWKGYIDEFKVYGRALSAEEVSNLYENDSPSGAGVSVAMSGGSNSVNEEGYGEGVYDWSDLIGNSGDDRAYAVTQDAIGNVYVGVQTKSSLQGSNAGDWDAALVKYNSVGVKQWTQQTGSSAADYVKAVATDSEGNAYIVGNVNNAAYDGQSASGDHDLFITKYSSNGTKQWSKQFGTAQYDQATDAVIDNNTLYIIGSTTGTMSGASKTSASATDNDSFITRLDLNGNILGSDQFGVSGNSSTVASDIAFDDSGNYYVAGSTTGALDSESHSGSSKKDMFIRKYNSSNVRQWTKLIGNSTHDQGGGVHLGLSSSGATIYLQDQTGGTINSVSAPTSASDHLVIHAIRASDGAFEWTKFTSHRANAVSGIGADSSGYIYTLHDSSVSPAGYDEDLDGNYQITKFNSAGTEQWSRLTGSGDSGFDFPLGMYVTKGGQLYVVGTTQAGVLNSSSTWDYKFHGETSAGGFDAVIFKANGANDYVGRDTITVVLNTAPSANVTVNIAGVSTEFTVEPSQLTFTTSNWNTPQTVYIHAIQDNTTDGNQTENLTITTSSSDSNYNGLSANSPVTITDQTPIAPSVGIGFDNATVTEGNSGTQTRTLTAYLDQLHSSNVTINLAYGSGSSCSATSGSSNDFAYASSSMTISAGQSQATQSVTIYGDTTFEDNETVCIDISSVTNGVEEGTQRATLTILNDDAAGPAAPVLNSVTAGVQQNTIAW
ncbi:MAG: LamG-like jellyroll fold domain-containing protein, partial [Deltaproteobacteria bacterium]